MFLFAGADEPAARDSGIWQACEWLAHDPGSPVHRYNGSGEDVDARFDVRAVFQQGHRELWLGDMHPFLQPAKGRYGLRDYEKMFCAESGRDIFEMRGVDRQGCIVVVRPDQHVAEIVPLDEHEALSGFFARFLVGPAEAGAEGVTNLGTQ